MATMSLRCKCGAFRGVVHSLSPAQGNRCVCYCDDCQAYAHYLGQAETVLDANGGTDITPVTPSQIEITVGHETLSALRLSPKGLFRWYADCCNTPIANTVAWARMPFAGVVHAIMDPKASGTRREEALGPIRARVQGKFGKGPLPAGVSKTAPLAFLLRTARFVWKGFWGRKHQPSPFFHPTGKPRVKPKVLTPSERENLRKLCGP